MESLFEFAVAYYKPVIEIGLLSAIVYYLMLLFRGTRGAAVLTGFIIALLAVVGVTQIFQLEVINWILSRVLTFLAVAVLVIFQPELRRALAQLGSKQIFGTTRQRGELIDVFVEAATELAQKRHGALVAIEREVGFRGVAETGVALDARATSDLLKQIFYPNTPLHDGGVIVHGDRVVAAGCIFPLTQRDGLGTNVGMRHRAAIGMTEETDAVVVVVSEETGEISVAYRGQLVQGLDGPGLRAFLATMLIPLPAKAHWVRDWVRRGIDAVMVARPAASESGFAGAEETKSEPPPPEEKR